MGALFSWGSVLGVRLKSLLPVHRYLSCEAGRAGRLPSQDLQGVATHLQGCRHVVVMVGAGMSVSAGLPDFRTPGTGLYDSLQMYDLPYPEAIFELGFFRRNPRPFWELCRHLWPGTAKPTPAHHFVALLQQKGLLQRCYSQNIDSLETEAGLPKDMLVAAHGNFDSATCLGTGQKVPPEEVREAVMAGPEACSTLSEKHGGLVKPDIVFFGENLPNRFFGLAPDDFDDCDLLLVLGTSLQVQPFAGLIRQVRTGVPRLLINRERVGEDKASFMPFGSPGFRFDEPGSQDVWFAGDCDEGVWQLARLLGWEAELQALCRRGAAAGGA